MRYEGCAEVVEGRVELCDCVLAYGDCLRALNASAAEASSSASSLFGEFDALCARFGCDCDGSRWRAYFVYSCVVLAVMAAFFVGWALLLRVRRFRLLFSSNNAAVASEEDALIAAVRERSLLDSQQSSVQHHHPPILVVPESIAEEEQPAEAADEHKEATAAVADASAKKKMCRVCMDREIDSVFVPCGHRVTCVGCGMKLTQCPLCRRELKMVVKTFD